MKIFVIVFIGGLLLITAMPCSGENGCASPAHSPDDSLYPLKGSNGKYGYIDKTGAWVIHPTFDGALAFSEGLARIEVRKTGSDDWDTANRRGFIDRKGVLVTPLFDWVGDFSEGLAQARVGMREGFIDKSGAWVVHHGFYGLSAFSEGLAAARTGEKWGYINKTGAWVIRPQFDFVRDFKEGLAEAGIHGVGPYTANFKGPHHGYIDRAGAWVIEPRFEHSSPFSCGLAWVRQGGTRGFIDKTGAWVDPDVGYFPEALATLGGAYYSEGLAAAKQNDKVGYFDLDGEWAIHPQFDGGSRFSDGLARVKVGYKYGFIDRSGGWVVDPQFVDASDFYHGLARVRPSVDEWGYIDKKGVFVVLMNRTPAALRTEGKIERDR